MASIRPTVASEVRPCGIQVAIVGKAGEVRLQAALLAHDLANGDRGNGRLVRNIGGHVGLRGGWVPGESLAVGPGNVRELVKKRADDETTVGRDGKL